MGYTLVEQPSFRLVGISIRTDNLRAADDIPQLWGRFLEQNLRDSIPTPLDEDILAVYYDYETDASAPYSYFIGCRVAAGSAVPTGLTELSIPAQTCAQVRAEGPFPDCLLEAWHRIWNDTELPRSFTFDYEVYGAHGFDTDRAQLNLYIAVSQ